MTQWPNNTPSRSFSTVSCCFEISFKMFRGFFNLFMPVFLPDMLYPTSKSYLRNKAYYGFFFFPASSFQPCKPHSCFAGRSAVIALLSWPVLSLLLYQVASCHFVPRSLNILNNHFFECPVMVSSSLKLWNSN